MWPTRLALALVFVLLVTAPFLVSEYYVEILIVLLINTLLASSYRLVTTTGDWSLCHVVLMGAGAYATALIAKLLGWNFWVSLPLAGLAAAVVGLSVVYPLLRTKGFGFFIGSFAVGEFVRLTWVKFHNPFGGPRGMIGIPTPELGTIDFFFATPYYFLTLIVVLLSLWILFRIDRAPLVGDVMKAIYMDEELAQSVGVDVSRYRAIAFMTGAFFAGIAGVLLAHRLGAIDPHNFDINTMVYLVIWVVVGGTKTFWGPIIGVVVMTFIFEWSRPLLEWRPLLFGGILIFFLIFMPGGLESLGTKARSWWSARQSRSPADTPGGTPRPAPSEPGE
ncbi:MAG: branched-chain amino acid ABC transporter permease [Alphaproteobacteria bacterium]|nr:branched-chain amino acid ABC transporter permease [Alphaproteobacteria bacterium]